MRGPWRWAAGGGLLVLAAVVVVLLTSGSGHRIRGRGPAVRTGPAPALPALPALPAPPGEDYGVNVNRLFNDRTYVAAQIAADLAAVHATGATLARTDALWEAAEPAAPVAGHHHYDWGFDDQIAGSLAAHELTWLPIIDYSAPWAQSIPGQDHSPPRSAAAFAAYGAALAARYGTGGGFWRRHPGLAPVPVTAIEIWNEPDNGEFWTPSPDAGRYGALYLAAREAIDAVDPGARVIVGGLTNPTAFLPAMVQAQPTLRGHVDGVAIHPYGSPAVVLTRVRAARAALISLGMASVPLYVTEFGWTIHPPGALDYVPAARRPGDIVTTLTALGHLGCGLAASLLYTWVTPERNPADSQDWFGIADPADPATPTADTAAFTAGLRAAAQPGPAAPCTG
jgi:hypothetical protein